MGAILPLVIKEIPGILQMIKDHHAAVNPALPPLTDSEAVAIARQALDSSEAKDDDWLAVHPQ